MAEFFVYILLFSDVDGDEGAANEDEKEEDKKKKEQGGGAEELQESPEDMLCKFHVDATTMRKLAWTFLHSIFEHAKHNVLAKMYLNLVEGWYSMDTLNFLLDAIEMTTSCHIGITYQKSVDLIPDGVHWVCYMRCRWVINHMFENYGQKVKKNVAVRVAKIAIDSGDEVLEMRRIAKRMLREDPLGENYNGMETEEEQNMRKLRNLKRQAAAERKAKLRGKKSKFKPEPAMHRKVRFDWFLNEMVKEYCKQQKSFTTQIVKELKFGKRKQLYTNDMIDFITSKAPTLSNEVWLKRMFCAGVLRSKKLQKGLSVKSCVKIYRRLLGNEGTPQLIEQPIGHQARVPKARIPEHLASRLLATVNGSLQDVSPIFDRLLAAMKADVIEASEMQDYEKRQLQHTVGIGVFVRQFEKRRGHLAEMLAQPRDQICLQKIISCYQQLVDDLNNYIQYRSSKRKINLGTHVVPRLVLTDGSVEETEGELTTDTQLLRLKIAKYLDLNQYAR
eukprot:CAMPEP_0197533312 /NCGR_PEP_ID=MMETSP1318-20131121/43040_1 /TAXON_ID=552666 /ORGANISM="Partenskyella glossopodia, Strain RCC365" /LENGTH=502 /DNA_ID=CAMNT_0043090183 /DNA_START=81 /DNA_END=1589 /DNA_ORIENTATION=+